MKKRSAAAWPLLLALLLSAAAVHGADLVVGTSDELHAAVSAPQAAGPLRIRLGPNRFELDRSVAIATPGVELVGSGPRATSLLCSGNLTTAIVVDASSFRLRGISLRGCQGPALLLRQPDGDTTQAEWDIQDADFEDNGGGGSQVTYRRQRPCVGECRRPCFPDRPLLPLLPPRRCQQLRAPAFPLQPRPFRRCRRAAA